ncbi:flagellar biosynthetic protein FliO [Vreelandella utahensis]|uniref:flagellar biosynthetic protein FliO n=1 Tax=Vreelandella halophila TaxID=86177 RepID=UPI000986E029|nr:flagellar biosynthetic protein FliO [Halomonas utahensis]
MSRPALFSRLALGLTGLLPLLVMAQEAQEETSSDGMGAGAPDTMTTALTLGAGLIVVLAVIIFSGWIARRVQGLGGVNTQALKVVAVLSVGQKERVALVEVGGKQILIGITPQSVRTLHVFDEPVVTASQPAGSGDFARKLQQVMGRGTTGDSNDV